MTIVTTAKACDVWPCPTAIFWGHDDECCPVCSSCFFSFIVLSIGQEGHTVILPCALIGPSVLMLAYHGICICYCVGIAVSFLLYAVVQFIKKLTKS
eukprot:7140474-Ditylum_brightwellii.AAC.1